MMPLLATVFFASLVGSPHCAGMCGGLVAFGAGAGARPAMHHLGRGLVYALFGVVAGTLGVGVNLSGGARDAAALVAAGLMVLWAVLALLEAWGVTRRHLLFPAWLKRTAMSASFAARRLPPALRGLGLGAASSLIPCGWLYAFVISAGGTGSPLWGGLSMVAFWAGTLPVLVGVGAVAQRLAVRARVSLPRWAPLLVLCTGLVSLVVRWPAPKTTPSALQEVTCHGHGR
jgi:sulfite exporter TauE/SafE